MKCIIYARTATVKQAAAKPAAIDHQIKTLKEYTEKKGDEVVAIFSDTGYSNTDKQQPGLRAALDLSSKEKPDYLLATSLDRLSRDSQQLLTACLELHGMGVGIQQLNQPDQINLSEIFATSLSMGYSEQMSLRIKKGMAWKKQKTA